MGLYKEALDWSRLWPFKHSPFRKKRPADGIGRYGRGNIDLDNRQVYKNPDGSISTERSFSVNEDGKEVLLPTIIGGKPVSQKEAVEHYRRTGEHLGRFDTVQEANDYAEKLHLRQAGRYGSRGGSKK